MKLAMNKNSKIVTQLLATVLCASGLLACSTDSETPSSVAQYLTATKAQPAYQGKRLNGHKSVALSEHLYLANSENLGLFLYDDKGEVITSTVGNYEGLDVRTIADKTYIVTINKELQQSELFSLSGDKLELEQKLKLPASGINNVCLYQPRERELQVLMLTEDMQLQQRLVLDERGNGTDFTLLRAMPAPPNSSACVADDKTHNLYLAEEQIAIWQYPLNPESEVARTPVAMVAPYGQIEGEIKDLSILPDGRLLVSLPDMKQLLVLQPEAAAWTPSWLVMPEASTVESATLAADTLVWFDKESDTYFKQKLSLPEYDLPEQKNAIVGVKADAQTTPVSHFGDAADDPAIWPNRKVPEQSRILGTDKTAGLYVYNMAGEQLQFLETGRVNNVDISFGFTWSGREVDLAAASNRTLNAIALYAIDAQGRVAEIGSVATSLPDVYGLCSYKSNTDGQHYVFINDENGKFQQYKIYQQDGVAKGDLVREFSVPSQPEGCVVDEKSETLYLGEEGAGVWTTSAIATDASLDLVIPIDEKVLFGDVEGLSIYQGPVTSYLVVSSQGNNSYVLYNLKDKSLVGNFRVVADYAKGVDGASETDGLAVSSFNFGGQYSQGLMVVQDGRNVMPSQPQNFKLIPWAGISDKLALESQ